MEKYTVVNYTPTISGSSAVAAGQIVSATEAIGNAGAGWLDSVNLYNLCDKNQGFVLYLLTNNLFIQKTAAAADEGLGVWLQAAAPSTDAQIYAAMTLHCSGAGLTTGEIKLKFTLKSDY